MSLYCDIVESSSSSEVNVSFTSFSICSTKYDSKSLITPFNSSSDEFDEMFFNELCKALPVADVASVFADV